MEFAHLAHRLDGPQVLAFLYLAGATTYGILAFRNFSAGEVVTAIFLFSALPLGLIFFTASPQTLLRAKNRGAALALAVIAAPVMFFIQFSGLREWSGYVSNFPNQRMDFGGGFHQDSVFHVAIIQGVLNTGYPTTGQHLEPWVSYHALSHYVDAVALWLLGIDPWESYALLFFAKGVAITLSVIYFAMKVAEPHSRSFFWLTLLIVYPAFTATWLVIGSHGQWFPMIVLALSAHRVFVVAMKDQRIWGDYALLTVLVVVLSLGKISLGFSFAVLVGLWLFFRRPIDWRLIVTGVAWVTFLAAYASGAFNSRLSSGTEFSSVWTRDVVGLFRYASEDILAVSLLTALAGIVARLVKSALVRSFTSSLAVSLAAIALAVVIATENLSDVAYFFHGLFSVALLLSLPLLAGALAHNPQSAAGPSSHEKSGLRLLAFVASFLFALSPVVSKEQGSPYTSLQKAKYTAVGILGHTYLWANEGAEPVDRMTTWQAALGKQFRVEEPEKLPYASRLRDALKDFVEVNGLSNESPLLYLTSEQFEAVAARISNPDPLWTGLAVTAVTGLPLVFGVPDPDFRNYGFSDYDEGALVKRENEASFEDLCGFDRPVIIAIDITSFNFMLACRGV